MIVGFLWSGFSKSGFSVRGLSPCSGFRSSPKTMFLSTTKNISHRSYVADQNYVSHKKIFCGNKKKYLTPKRETRVD